MKTTHKKLVSRLFAKNTLAGVKNNTVGVLDALGFLKHDFMLKLRSEYAPILENKVTKKN